MAGRTPLPVAVKKLKGTLQRCRTNPHEPQPGGARFDWANLQGLCIACHNAKTARETAQRR